MSKDIFQEALESRDLLYLKRFVKAQKENLQRAGLKINVQENQLMEAHRKADAMGAIMIYLVKKYGDNNQLFIEKEELDAIMPGTEIQDHVVKGGHVVLQVTDVSDEDKEAFIGGAN